MVGVIHRHQKNCKNESYMKRDLHRYVTQRVATKVSLHLSYRAGLYPCSRHSRKVRYLLLRSLRGA